MKIGRGGRLWLSFAAERGGNKEVLWAVYYTLQVWVCGGWGISLSRPMRGRGRGGRREESSPPWMAGNGVYTPPTPFQRLEGGDGKCAVCCHGERRHTGVRL